MNQMLFLTGKKSCNNALCLENISDYDSEEIRSLRDRYKISQAALAALLNTSTSAVRQRETGRKHPIKRGCFFMSYNKASGLYLNLALSDKYD